MKESDIVSKIELYVNEAVWKDRDGNSRLKAGTSIPKGATGTVVKTMKIKSSSKFAKYRYYILTDKYGMLRYEGDLEIWGREGNKVKISRGGVLNWMEKDGIPAWDTQSLQADKI